MNVIAIMIHQNTKDQINKGLAKKFKICWHDVFGGYKDGEVDYSLPKCDKCGKTLLTAFSWNPDFFTDPVRLLREMEKESNWDKFRANHPIIFMSNGIVDTHHYININYMTDLDGKLAVTCWEWFERREK